MHNVTIVLARHVARREGVPSCPKQIYLTHFLTSFAINIPQKCHKLGYKPKNFLLTAVAALLCTHHPLLLQWLVEYTYRYQ